jgi:hypothetical protein
MKRFDLLPLLALLACQASPVSSLDSQANTATLKRAVPCDAAVLGEAEIVDGDGRVINTRMIIHEDVVFYTTPCASDVHVKVYFVYPGEAEGGNIPPDARRKPIWAGSAPETNLGHPGPGVHHAFTFQWVTPKQSVIDSFPGPWFPKFFVEVRSGGTLIGSFNVVEH